MKKITLITFIIIYGCNSNNEKATTKNSFEGNFTNTITGYNLNCETVIQKLKIKNNSFEYKRFCQLEPSRVFDSVNGVIRKIADLSFLLLNADSTKEFGLKIISDSLVSLTINPGKKDEFVTELRRKADVPK